MKLYLYYFKKIIKNLLFLLILTLIIFLVYKIKSISNWFLLDNKRLEVISSSKIAIISFIEHGHEDNYLPAIKTVRCYALHNNYSYVLLNDIDYPEFNKECKQGEFYFKRHCVIAYYLHQKKDIFEYALIIDADVALINPRHKLEYFLPKGNEEIIFYDRMFNDEIMAGSYMLKNSQYSRQFLIWFADYYFKVPKYNDGYDNVALHAAFLDYVKDKKFTKQYNHCMKIWSTASGYDLNMIFVSCMRWIIKKYSDNSSKDFASFDNGKLIVLSKYSNRRWCRDTWLTSWKFCRNDFFLHGYKTNEYLKEGYTFLNEFNPTDKECLREEYLWIWEYNKSSIVNCKIIKNSIKDWINFVDYDNSKNLHASGVLRI
uniref:Nucleotid_trans domain-containing protein n=1 Tax=Parastrongyloides trichosuri TaxID=131310 RepID=A0A0N4ZK65_PARTI